MNTELNDDESKATITVQIKYYDDERMTVETLTDRQIWEYNSKLGRWFLDSPLPAFH